MAIFHQLDKHLQGQPDTVLTVSLLLVAGVAVLIALSGNRVLKALALAWLVLP